MDLTALSPETLCLGAFAACMVSPRRLAMRLGGAGALAVPLGTGVMPADVSPATAMTLAAVALVGGGGLVGLLSRLVFVRLFPGFGPLLLLRAAFSAAGLVVLLMAAGVVHAG